MTNLASKEIDRHNSSEHLRLPIRGEPFAGGCSHLSLQHWFDPTDALSTLTVCPPPAVRFSSPPCPSCLCPDHVSPSSPTDCSPRWSRALSRVVTSRWSAACVQTSTNGRLNLSVPGPGARPETPESQWGLSTAALGSRPCPALPSSPPACWVLDLHYGLVEFLTILRWKPGARAPLVYKT